jgi:predicted RNA methylase
MTPAHLDQYYTQPAVARACVADLWAWGAALGFTPETVAVLEPSAGAGAFLDAVTGPAFGLDLDPPADRPDIMQADFLAPETLARLPAVPVGRQRLVLGNPPFGRKSALAVAFLNRALDLAPVVAFIVPLQFRKWSAQSLVRADARLRFDRLLPDESFVFMGRPYRVRCCFQIWTRADVAAGMPDLRLAQRPRTTHPDFDAYQYNRTDIAFKYFSYDWDFAVPRQGYQDYTLKVRSAAGCDPKQQWIFFKAHSPEALARLERIDFVALSQKNTRLPGFGKADVVAAYEALDP